MTKTQQMVATMLDAAAKLDKARDHTDRPDALYVTDIVAMTLGATVLRFVALCLVDDETGEGEA